MLSQEGLERIRRTLPDGATLADALAFHRRLGQLRRQPSRCMRPWEDEADEGSGPCGVDAGEPDGHARTGP